MKDKKREEYYNFFKEKFDIDFTNMSSNDAQKLIDKINIKISSRINDEQQKKKKIIKEFYNAKERFNLLKKQYIDLKNYLSLIENN